MQSSLCCGLLTNSINYSTLCCLQTVMSKVVCAFPQSQVRCCSTEGSATSPSAAPCPPAHHSVPLAPCPAPRAHRPVPLIPCPMPCAPCTPAPHPMPIALCTSPCAPCTPCPSPRAHTCGLGRAGSAQRYTGLQFQGYSYKPIFSDILTLRGGGGE